MGDPLDRPGDGQSDRHLGGFGAAHLAGAQAAAGSGCAPSSARATRALPKGGLRHPARSARVAQNLVHLTLKSPVKSKDSLIRRINSLMTRFNSLLGANKFPVPMRRELARKSLNLALDS